MSHRSTSAIALAPVLVTTLAVGLLSVMDGFMKAAALALGAYSAMLCRGFVSVALTVPLWALSGAGRPSRAALRVHLLRGTVATAMALLFFHAITLLPLAEAIALSFVAPLIALYLAAVMLGERIRARAVWASLAGVVGVGVICAPRLAGGFGAGSGEGIAALLASAVLYAWNLVLQRRQAQIAGPQEIALFGTLVPVVLLGAAAPLWLRWPEAGAWPVLATAAVLGVTASLLMSWAYARAEAQALVPIEYSAFVWAALVGWIAFAEPLGIATVVGTALIVAACLAAARSAPPEPTAV